MAQYLQSPQRKQIKRNAFRVALFVTLCAVTTLLASTYFNSLDGIKVLVSGENYSPVVAPQDAKLVEQVVADGDWVEQGNTLFRLTSEKSDKEANVYASTAGLFYSIEGSLDRIEVGDILGFVKINQPANALYLQLEKGQARDFNIGDTVILSRENASFKGKVTLLMGERERGSGQKIGIAFIAEQAQLAFLPGTEFRLHAPAKTVCQSTDCG